MDIYGQFLDNKYTKWYRNIINAAVLRNLKKKRFDGCETHHILPRSCGGDNKKSNLIVLTAKEHFIVHLLLLKMFDDERKYKMYNAIHRMAVSGNHRMTSMRYHSAKKYHGIAVSVRQKQKSKKQLAASIENLKKAVEANRGKKYSPERCDKISKALIGRTFNKKMPRGADNHSSKPVTDGQAIFVSCTEAARAYNVSMQAIGYRVKNNVGKWKYVVNNK